jgi:hypothetical protein
MVAPNTEKPALSIIDMVKVNFEEDLNLPITPLARQIIDPINALIKTFRDNLSPFAENIIVILGESDYGLTKDETVRIRPFFDLDSPVALKLILLQQQVRSLNKGIVIYSVDVVSLSETQKTQEEQVADFADYLDSFEKPILTHRKITEEEYARLLESIREQELLLGALRTAQPVISAAARYGGTIISEIEKATFALVLAIELKIDAHYAEILAYYQTLEVN